MSNLDNLTQNEKEMYLLLCGWTYEKLLGDTDIWWFPPKNSPILEEYTMTRIVDHAFEWQRQVDEYKIAR